MKSVVWIAVLALVVTAASSAGAQETPTISTDRPSFSTGSAVVPEGRLQLEAGLALDFYEGAAVGDIAIPDRHIGTAPQLLARYGLAEFAEVRLQVPDIAYDFAAPVSSAEPAWGAAALGAKLGTSLTDQVSVAVIPSVSVGVETGNVEAGATGAIDVGVAEAVGLFFNVGATNYEGFDGREFSYAASAGAGFGLTDEFGAYVEWHTVIDGDDAHFAAAGVTYLIGPQLQLDAYAGSGLSEAGRVYGGVGVAKLF